MQGVTEGDLSVKVGAHSYNLSSRGVNPVFLCESDAIRRDQVISIVKQLAEAKCREPVEVIFMTAEPEEYKASFGASSFDVGKMSELLREMERRYDILLEDYARNQICYNLKHPEAQLATTVVLLDGFDRIIDSEDFSEFINYVKILAMKSRAAGFKFVALMNRIPENAEHTLEYFGTPVNVHREGFNMKDVTNTILRSFYNLGYEPCLGLSRDKEKGTVHVSIGVDIEGSWLSFSYNYDEHTVKYGVYYRYYEKLPKEDIIEVYRVFRTDETSCFLTLDEDPTNDTIYLSGGRYESTITPVYLECLIEEILSLKVIGKIKEIIEKQRKYI